MFVLNLCQPLTDELSNETSSIFPWKFYGKENTEVKLTICSATNTVIYLPILMASIILNEVYTII